tara:strand:- start:1074 stop:1505 length:432 start_codon:yes stop_codon:yes gene_type:complete
MKNKKTILFVCTGNSCRSQMAEGLMRKYIEKDFSIISAGLKPSTVNPQAIKAMKEINIDISGQSSNHVDEYLDQNHEYVITVCDNAKESCPVGLSGKKNIHWSIPDPYVDGKDNDMYMPRYRSARDMLSDKISILAKIINDGE